MNKKVMAVAVAGAFAAPTAALAQASNVQIFGTMYLEYSYAHQGQIASGSGGDLVNADLLQTPGSEIGFKGEEALGGGLTAWFQCTSTADLRGPGTTAYPNGIFCGRNSAIGLKGGWGNVYAGNWDMPMKKTAGAARIVSDTGLWGAGFLLFGNSSTFNDSATPFAWSRRQNNTIFYDTPVWNGFQVFTSVTATSAAAPNSNNLTGAKPRAWGIAGNYTNGPLLITAGYENHKSYIPGGAAAGFNGTDSAWQVGGAYQAGPVKIGILYTSQKWDMGGFAVGTDAKVAAWNIAGEWNIQGPHALRGGYTKANSTTGSYIASTIAAGNNNISLNGNRIFNGGASGTGGSLWQVQYVYNASKRTELTAGAAFLSNDTFARYSLGGYTAPAGGQNQNGIGVSIKNTF